jgi:hypothetical protein
MATFWRSFHHESKTITFKDVVYVAAERADQREEKEQMHSPPITSLPLYVLYTTLC